MVEIKVIINNYREFCGSCHFQDRGIEDWYCTCYRKYLTANPDSSFSRLPECIVSEGELAALREIEKENKRWIEGCNCGDCPLSAYEACDEICGRKVTMINKIADLLAEIEHKTTDESFSWEDIPDYGDLMTVCRFREFIVSGCFIGSDGIGYYALSDKYSNMGVTFCLEQFDMDVSAGRFTHVMWFNK
jgi:hypothetical protein